MKVRLFRVREKALGEDPCTTNKRIVRENGWLWLWVPGKAGKAGPTTGYAGLRWYKSVATGEHDLWYRYELEEASDEQVE